MPLPGALRSNLGFRSKNSPWVNQASYSGSDIIPAVYGIDPNDPQRVPKYFVLGDIGTMTYSIHRDKGPVRTLGRYTPKGFVRGQRTIAGSMVFSVFDRRALWELSKIRSEKRRRVAVADELPGFDIILYFSNEYGHESTLILYNVQIVDEGQSHSVQDMYIENTMSYMCQDIDLLEPVSASAGLPSTAVFIKENFFSH